MGAGPATPFARLPNPRVIFRYEFGEAFRACIKMAYDITYGDRQFVLVSATGSALRRHPVSHLPHNLAGYFEMTPGGCQCKGKPWGRRWVAQIGVNHHHGIVDKPKRLARVGSRTRPTCDPRGVSGQLSNLNEAQLPVSQQRKTRFRRPSLRPPGRPAVDPNGRGNCNDRSDRLNPCGPIDRAWQPQADREREDEQAGARQPTQPETVVIVRPDHGFDAATLGPV